MNESANIIGGALVDNEVAAAVVADRNFRAPGTSGAILAAIRRVAAKGETPDLIAVSRAMGPAELASVGGVSGLSRLAADADLEAAKIVLRYHSATTEHPAAPLLIDIADALRNPVEPVFLVDGIIEDATTGALIGESTAGKSFVAIGLACSSATGTPFAGHATVRAGVVIYAAGEGHHGIPRRVAAWQEHSGVTIPAGRFYLTRGRLEIDAAGARRLAEEVAEITNQAGPPVLLVVDTLARSMPAGSDENSVADIMEFMNAIDSLRDRFGCTVVIVHHSGHAAEAQGRARGSSAFRAALDFEILVDKRKMQLRWTKTKDAEIPDAVAFEIVSIAASAVAVFGEPVKDAGPELTKGEELGISTLRDAFSRLGRNWASVEEWRSDYYRRHPGDSTPTKRQAFHRCRESLISKRFVIVDNDVYTLIRPSVTSVTGRDNQSSVTCSGSRDTRDTPLLKGVALSRSQDTPADLAELDL